MDGDSVTVERVIPAPPEKIFALLADPARHGDFDGSGTVKAAKEGSGGRLGPGSVFGISMRMGIPYSMLNEVVEYEEDRRIAWRPKAPGVLGVLAPGGRVWRYELEPADGGTRVRETWDISGDKLKGVFRRGGMAEKTRQNMTRTLERLETLAAGGGG